MSNDFEKDTREKISEVVEKHLPAQLGQKLQERLDQLAGLENKITELNEAHEYKNRMIKDYEEKEKLWGDLNNREFILSEKEQQLELDINANNILATHLDHRKEMLNLKETINDERRDDCFAMVGLVFGNNKFKHEKTTSEAVFTEGEMIQTGRYDNNSNPIYDVQKKEVAPKVETTEGEG
jgi:TolA-binding protein